MAEIFVHLEHRGGGGKAVTGVAFTIKYADTEATISILEFDPVSPDKRDDALRQRLRDLADALRGTGPSSPSISWHPRDESK